MANKRKTPSVPWHESAESQLTRLRNDRGAVVAGAVETLAECAAVTMGLPQVTIQVYLAGRMMVFNLMGIPDEEGQAIVDGANQVGWYANRTRGMTRSGSEG